jgi:hypothetical protein
VKSAARILLKGDSSGKKRASIPAISLGEVAEIRQFFPRDKFFILGHARSGTTLLMRLARLHPEVHCSYQAHFFTRRPLLKSLVDTPEAEEWLKRKSNRWNRGGDLSPLVLRAAADFILEREAAAEGKRIVGDKSPSSTIHGQAARDMHAVYPRRGWFISSVTTRRAGVGAVQESGGRIGVSKARTGASSPNCAGPGPVHERIGFDLHREFYPARGFGVTNLSEIGAEGLRLYGKKYLGRRRICWTIRSS